MSILAILLAIMVLLFIAFAIIFAVLFYGGIAYYTYRLFKFLWEKLDILGRTRKGPEPKRQDLEETSQQAPYN